VLLAAAPRAAHACAVCTGAESEATGRAFLVGSIALSLLPLAAVGAMALWLRRRARSLDDPADRRAAAAPPSLRASSSR
jgi:hypothetical protein